MHHDHRSAPWALVFVISFRFSFFFGDVFNCHEALLYCKAFKICEHVELFLVASTALSPQPSPLVCCHTAPDAYLISRNCVLKARLPRFTAGAYAFCFARDCSTSFIEEQFRTACALRFGLPSEVVVCHSSFLCCLLLL